MTRQPTILLGVTGGIAAYKAAELLRDLQKAGMDVRVMMTHAATRFMAPLTFQTLSTHPVHLDDEQHLLRSDSAITHVEEGNAADMMVVAPATANTLAKMANGYADNLLTATYLAYAGTVIVAPSMNTNMWSHPATQHNMDILRQRGVVVLEPGAGELACGVYGSGRMVEPDSIVAEVKLRLQVARKTDLGGLRVMITAGGTREPIDAVRYVGNRSSGKMGFALARAAYDRGAVVDLVQANVYLPDVPGARQTKTRTASEMHHAVMSRLPEVDILIMAAAVADYKVVDPRGGKMPKTLDDLSIHLEPTVDILCDVASARNGQFIVGFAAEYGPEGVERARRKLERKNLDMIVYNDISRADIGFSSDYNEVTLLTRDGEARIERAQKETVAELILDHIARRVHPLKGTDYPIA
jgi:phosphopantothenoylcysteine decarboxylase / phosphopantothenate---cysteine ligase